MTQRTRARAVSLALGCFAFVGAESSTVRAQANDPEPFVGPVPEPAIELSKTEFPNPKDLEPTLGRALGRPDGFCKDADYELSSSEAKLCDLAPAAAERCPGFVRACEKPLTGASESGSSGRVSEGRRRAGRGHRRGDDGESEGVTIGGSEGPIGALLGFVIKLVAWTILALGIGAMIFAVVRALLGRRRDPTPPRETVPDPEAPVAPLFPTGLPEEFLARSRELAMAGELKAAMSLLLRALLRHLEIRGRLELHPSRTNGDYVRSLRQKGHESRELRSVAAEVETIEFGAGRASSEAFSALHARVSKLVGIGGVALALVALGALSGCKKKPPAEGSVNSCGEGARGYSVLCEALEARGSKIRRRFTSVENVAEDVDRIVVLDDALERSERLVLLEWVEEGGTLVVFDGVSDYDDRLTLSTNSCGGELVLDKDFWKTPADAKQRFRLPGARTLVDEFHGNRGGRGLVRCGNAAFAVMGYRGDGVIVTVADPRFAMNASLGIEQNAALAAALVAPTRSTVELIGGWTGSGTELPAQSLARSGLLPWFLQVLLFAFALALYRGAPFGTRREPVVVTRRAFAEHALALGDAYSRARASRIALVHFGSWALERLRVRLSASKHGRLSDLAGAVAARHAVSEAEVMSLVVAVRSAEDQAHDSANESEHLAALRRLSALVKKTGGSS